jgi:hypothetical protein
MTAGLCGPAPIRQEFLHAPHDLGWSYVEHICQQHYRPNGRTPKSTLHQADVRAIKVSGQPQALLGNIARFAKLLECLPKGFLRASLGMDVFAARFRQFNFILVV